MPNWNPPRRNGMTMAASTITAAIMNQIRRRPTKSNERLPV